MTNPNRALLEALPDFQRTPNLIRFEDIIGPGEILELAQVGNRTLANWRGGKNLAGAGPFPAPFRTLKSGDLFDRRAVETWLRAHRTPNGKRRP